MSRLTKSEKRALRAHAKKRGGVAVSAHYNKGKIKFIYLGDWSKKKKRRKLFFNILFLFIMNLTWILSILFILC